SSSPQLSTLASLSFFLNDPAPSELYTLSLHDALPISARAVQGSLRAGHQGRRAREGSDRPRHPRGWLHPHARGRRPRPGDDRQGDRKSTRLNSSHVKISYAVFCLKKKKTITKNLKLYC